MHKLDSKRRKTVDQPNDVNALQTSLSSSELEAAEVVPKDSMLNLIDDCLLD